MKQKGFTAEQIIGKLREAEVLLSQRSTVGEASRKLGVTEHTYYQWRRETEVARNEEYVKLAQKDWVVHSAVQQGCNKKKRSYRSFSVTP
jgi:transposase-like protein